MMDRVSALKLGAARRKARFRLCLLCYAALHGRFAQNTALVMTCGLDSQKRPPKFAPMSFRSLTAYLALAATLSLCSCQYHFRRFAGASPAPGTVITWPGKSYSYVRGFCYDYLADDARSFFINGKMHKGVLDPKGVKLDADQVQRLVKGITVSQPKGPRTPCYAPHHAFVFYDAQGNVVAWFEMCFGCNQQRAYPAGTPEYVDRQALYQIASELGLPLGKGNKFYTDVCSKGVIP